MTGWGQCLSRLKASAGNLMQVFMMPADRELNTATMRQILGSGHSRVPVHRPGNRCSLQRMPPLPADRSLPLVLSQSQPTEHLPFLCCKEN